MSKSLKKAWVEYDNTNGNERYILKLWDEKNHGWKVDMTVDFHGNDIDFNLLTRVIWLSNNGYRVDI